MAPLAPSPALRTGLSSPLSPGEGEGGGEGASSTAPPPLTRGRAQVPAPRRSEVVGSADAVPDIPLDVGAMEIHLRRAPSWKRASAWGVDGAALALFGVALVRLAAGAVRAIGSPEAGLDWALAFTAGNAKLLASLVTVEVLGAFVYLTLSHALMGATFGKRLFRIRVVARDGRPPTLARSAARSAVALAFAAALGLGPLLALFTRSGRALHDFLAGTYVVELP